MAQEVIEGGVVTGRHMHEILRWLNKLAQNLDHISKLRDAPSWMAHFGGTQILFRDFVKLLNF